MIRLLIQLPNRQVKSVDWVRSVLTIGRAPTNDVVIAAENVSSQHAQVCLESGRYILRDLRSTNGTIIIRGNKRYLLKSENLEMALEVGDRVCLASMDNTLVVEAIHDDTNYEEEVFENTIIAEENAPPVDLEISLGDDHEALRSAVRLAREMAGLETIHEIAELTCQSCFRAFPKAQRVLFLAPKGDAFKVECAVGEAGEANDFSSKMMQSRLLLDRCLRGRKGFLFLFEQNRMQAIATVISPAEQLDSTGFDRDHIILCCPIFYNDRCYGFIEVEASLGALERESLTRRDLSLATLMGHLIATRLYDMENEKTRLKLARKATAGYLAATVGHCFKNLLFVPMSLSKMLPICLEQGKMNEVHWMLARNSVAIRYLDILSNEFAAASKDPTEGFEPCYIDRILEEIAELVNQIAPSRIEAQLHLPPQMPRVTCHGPAVRRLLLNLTLNAVDAFFGSSKTDQGRIELRADFNGAEDEVCLMVRDNGPGIPGPILENLREIFRQVQASADALSELQNIAERVRSTKEQGFKEHYGLGFLFVCQTVNQHQGRLEIESTLGEGARFNIYLPRNSASTAPATVAAE